MQFYVNIAKYTTDPGIGCMYVKINIFKFWTDFNGAITIKREDSDSCPKLRLTAMSNKREEHIRTYTAKEVKEEFAKK